jgi:hypothetical protein
MKKETLRYGFNEGLNDLRKIYLWLIPSFILIIIIMGEKYGNFLGGIIYYFIFLSLISFFKLYSRHIHFYEEYIIDVIIFFYKRKFQIKDIKSVLVDWNFLKTNRLSIEFRFNNSNNIIYINNDTKIIRSFAKKLKEKFPDLPYDESFETLLKYSDKQINSNTSVQDVIDSQLPTFKRWFTKE